jgi:BNR/Asp-box repeat
MYDPRQEQPPTATTPGDDFAVKNLPRPPQSPYTRVLLGVLAALLMVTVVGATIVALRNQGTLFAPLARVTPSVQPTATATIQLSTPTPERSPKENGWRQVTSLAGDIKFAASNPRRGYLCGIDQSGHMSLGVTTDGGQSWAFKEVPAAYDSCSLQISPTNALDVVINSTQSDACAAPCPLFDAHYSTDGGQTWQRAPVPANTVAPGGTVWSGAYLYIWASANQSNKQSGFLKVSRYGSPFTTLGLNTLLPGAQNVSIVSLVAGGAKPYLNLSYNGCGSQDCQAIVASANGGKTWTLVLKQSDTQLMYVVGDVLYAQEVDAQEVEGANLDITVSEDNGASWGLEALPSLPGGQPMRPDTQGSWVPTPSGSIFATSPDFDGVAYLHGPVTILPFAPSDASVAAVSVDANGRPQRIWGLIDPQDSLAGIYSRALV